MKCMMICIGLGLGAWALLLLAAMGLVAVIGPLGTAVVVGVPLGTTILGMIWLERHAPPASED